MQRGIQKGAHGVRDILGGERCAVRKHHTLPQLQGNGLPARRNLPSGGKLRLEFLRLPVDADQNTSGEVTDGLRSFIFHHQRVERFRLGAQAEAQLAAPLREQAGGGQGQDTKQAFHDANSFCESKSWKQLITMTSTTSGASIEGWLMAACGLANSRRRLPQDGSGSPTPKPIRPRLASPRIKVGIEIQNCASTIGLRLGTMCANSNRPPRQPHARACNTRSEWRNDCAPARMIRADEAQPSSPITIKVRITDDSGEVVSGSRARIIRKRNNHGIDRKISMPRNTMRSHQPPR